MRQTVAGVWGLRIGRRADSDKGSDYRFRKHALSESGLFNRQTDIANRDTEYLENLNRSFDGGDQHISAVIMYVQESFKDLDSKNFKLCMKAYSYTLFKDFTAILYLNKYMFIYELCYKLVYQKVKLKTIPKYVTIICHYFIQHR